MRLESEPSRASDEKPDPLSIEPFSTEPFFLEMDGPFISADIRFSRPARYPL